MTSTTLSKSTTASSHTGDTVETALATFTITGGTIGSTDRLEITTFWTRSGSAAAATPRVRLDGTTGTIYGTDTIVALAARNIQGKTIIYSNNATNAQKASGAPISNPYISTPNAIITSTADFTGNVDVVISGQLANAGDTITLQSYYIEQIS